MSLMDKIRGWLKRSRARCYIIDAGGLLDGNRSRQQPRDQIRAMQNLGRFAKRENLRIILIWHSSPLRDAAEGAEYEGMTVHYVAPDGNMVDRLVQLARRIGSTAVYVTASRELETATRDAGLQTMRLQSWLRAMRDNYFTEEREGNSVSTRKDDRRQHATRRPNPRRIKPGAPTDESRETPRDLSESSASEPKQPTTPTMLQEPPSPVSDLIDLV